MLRKGLYPYEYVNDWGNFKDTSLPEKDVFYNHLSMEDITDRDYTHSKKPCKDFEIKNVIEDHDLYVQSDILFLAEVFENLRNMCFEI